MSLVVNNPPSEAANFVTCLTNQGVEIRGVLTRFSRQLVVFEVYVPFLVLRTSEVLSDFQIVFENRPVYSGKAVISSLVSTGSGIICEATLDDAWVDGEILALATRQEDLQSGYRNFFDKWQGGYKIIPEYKLLVADIQMFLTDLRLWLDQVELGIRGLPSGDRAAAERQIVAELVPSVTASLNHLFEQFELITAGVKPEYEPIHSLYAKRQLHPLLLASPFMHRIYRKPLGYAGDYEMVGMILRDPHEGSSVFSKVLNRWFLTQVPAEAHRNRVKFLTQRIVEETARARAENRNLRIFNLGCGPAGEVKEFIEQHELSNFAEFTLLDFNEETLAFAENTLAQAIRRHHRATKIRMVKKSVAQVIKAAGRGPEQQYDLVYCAGLFDYLQDRVCKQLMNMFYDMVAPRGLLLTTNVEAANPIQRIMGYIFEWHLIYRNGKQMASLAPDDATEDDYKVTADITGCNVFIEVRKPNTHL